jgi:hypothetical protein
MESGIIKHQRVRLASAGEPATTAADPAACARPKQAVLVDRGGQPRAIEFTCGCGEVTLVELVYDASPSAPAAAPSSKERP